VNGGRPGGSRERGDALLAEVRGRRSVRRFAPDDVPDDDLRRMLDAARWAPSPTNRQPWRFLVVRDPAVRERLREATEAAFEAAAARTLAGVPEDPGRTYGEFFTAFTQAPVALVVLMRRPSVVARRLGEGLSDTERAALAGDLPAIGAAIQNLLLAAHALGYGACWMSGPLLAAAAIRAILGVPESLDLAAIVPVGRPAEAPAAPPRREVDRLLLKPKERAAR
jgi:nitroreductase